MTHAIGVVFANHHLQSLTERPVRRTAKRPSTSLRQRLARIAGTIRTASRPNGTDGSVAPAIR